MKKALLIPVVSFIAGAAITFLVCVPIANWINIPTQLDDGIRIERIIYRSGGELSEATIWLPSWEELYGLVEREAGVTVQRPALPNQGVSWKIKDISWERALTSLSPEGFETVKTGEKTFLVRPIKGHWAPEALRS